MSNILQMMIKLQAKMVSLHHFSFLASLPIRLYLSAVFWVAGSQKWYSFESTAQWFGNAEWGLGLPFPYLMTGLVTAAEMGGAVLLLLGLATRWATIPLMISMLVAAFTVHWSNGWQAVHDLMSPWASVNATAALDRLQVAKEILQTHGHYEWLTEYGHFVVSNNGVEWAVTYFVMLLALFFIGGGNYFSLDYWIKRKFMQSTMV